ncbi:hypothetical protein FCULG_00002286, partial [Fusarium culmorum]
NASWCCSRSSTASSSLSFLTCPRISIPLATSTPWISTPRCDTAGGLDLGPVLRSLIALLYSVLALALIYLARLLPFHTPFYYILEPPCMFIRGCALNSWAY